MISCLIVNHISRQRQTTHRLTGLKIPVIILGTCLVSSAGLVDTASGVEPILSATGDGEDLWVLRIDADRQGFTVLHRNKMDDLDCLHHVVAMRGRLASGGVTCADRRLWLVYDRTSIHTNLTVQSISAVTRDSPSQRRYEPPQFQQALPHGVFLRSLAANRRGPWALVRVEDPSSLRQIDAETSTIPATTPDAEGEQAPNDTQETAVPPEAASPPTPRPREPSKAIREDRLLKLDRIRWVKVDLPDDWPQESRGWLVMCRHDDPYPVLVAVTPIEDQQVVRVYRRVGQAWVSHHHEIGGHAGERTPAVDDMDQPSPFVWQNPVVMAVDGQLVIGLVSNLADQIRLELSVIRPSVITALGAITIDCPSPRSWAVVPHGVAAYGPTAALLVSHRPDQLIWSNMNLQGQHTQDTVLTEQRSQPLAETADVLMLIATVALSMLIVLLFWRRDPALNRLNLPQGVVLAELGWRALAGAIDLLPPVLIAAFVFNIPVFELMQYWPGHSGDWYDMLPGTLAIALFVAHTTVSELWTAKTLGKLITGMHVATLDGRPPNMWQVLVRNAMKAFDLVALLLLIMPLALPNRQRLGDLVAGTVVVTTGPTDRDSKKTDDHGHRAPDDEPDLDRHRFVRRL